MMIVYSVTVNQKRHGLSFYAAHVESLIRKYASHIVYKPSQYTQNNTRFSPIPTTVRDHSLLHIQYDTESLYYNSSSVVAILRTMRLFRFIRSLNWGVIITIHGFFEANRFLWVPDILLVLLIHIVCYKRKTILLAHSLRQIDHYKRMLPAYASQFRYIPHLVYPELVPTGSKNETSSPIKTFVTLGFIGDWKGQMELIKMFRTIHTSYGNFRYYIVGRAVSPAYYKKCQMLIQKHHLENYIVLVNTFISPSRFARYLKRADVYLSYHTRDRHESSGTLTHAAAAGLTIITRKTPYLELPKGTNVIAVDSLHACTQKISAILTGDMPLSKKRPYNIRKYNETVARILTSAYEDVVQR